MSHCRLLNTQRTIGVPCVKSNCGKPRELLELRQNLLSFLFEEAPRVGNLVSDPVTPYNLYI